MEQSKGIILIVVGLAAVLIIWKVGFKPVEKPTPASTTANSHTNENRQAVSSRTEQAAANNTGQSETQLDSSTQQMNNPNSMNRNSGYQTTGRTNTLPMETTMKISIPKDISQTELLTLYDEYTQISMAGRFNRGGRTNRGGTNSGMMGGGMMGGGMMGGGMMGGGFGG